MSKIQGGDSRNERKDIRSNMIAASLFSFINVLSAQSDKMGTRNLFKKPKQDKTVQTSRDIAETCRARVVLVWETWSICTRVRMGEIICVYLTTLSNSEDVSMRQKQKISTSWILYCSRLYVCWKVAETNVKHVFLCFKFSVMDERDRKKPDMLRELSDTEVLYCERIELYFVNIVGLTILKLFLKLVRK